MTFVSIYKLFIIAFHVTDVYLPLSHLNFITSIKGRYYLPTFLQLRKLKIREIN